MDANPLLDTLKQHLTPATIAQISQSLGTDPATTMNAVSMALPALLGGLASNASKPQGAAALDRALDAHDGRILASILDANHDGSIADDAVRIGSSMLGGFFKKS